MIKKIYFCLILFAILAACKEDQVGLVGVIRKTDFSNSSLRNYQLQAAYMYSTDGGNTYGAFPKLKSGETFLAKLVYNADPSSVTYPDDGSMQTIELGCPYLLDWSASDPQPKSVDANGVATFVVGGKNAVVSTVTNVPFSADDAAGIYEVVEDDWVDYLPGDQLTVQKIDATHIQIMEYPGTGVGHKPLVITVSPTTCVASVASQDNGAYSSATKDETVTSSDPSTSAFGGTPSFVHSCAGMIQLNLSFAVSATVPKASTSVSNGNLLVLKKL